MKKAILIAICGILTFGFLSNKSQAQLVLPTKEQVKWSEAEIGVIIHYDINIYVRNVRLYMQVGIASDYISSYKKG